MRGLALAALVGCLLPAPSARALDLNGQWFVDWETGFEEPPTTIVHSGDDLTLLGADGSLTPGSPFSTYAVHAEFSGIWADIVGRVMPSGNLMDGRYITPTTSGWGVAGLVLYRTSCADDDLEVGDGCDDTFRVEPCWTCSGSPSLCTPSPDGAACDDHDPCTSGETCGAGACGGTPVPACIDMDGTWHRHRVIDGLGVEDFVSQLRQIDGDVVGAGLVGAIDVTTGAFDLRSVNHQAYCTPFSPLIGTVAADGQSYTATGFVARARPGEPFQCDIYSITETATRATTTSTSTSTSSTTSTTLPSGTVCQTAPMTGCRQPTQPRKAKLMLTDRTPDIADAVTWKWTKGAATDVAAFGDPTTTTDVAACLYDGGGALHMTLRMPAGAAWRARTFKGFSYAERALTPDGVSKATLSAGVDGKAKITLGAKGALVPMPALDELSLPVRLQLQGNGQCWEAVFADPDEQSAFRFKASSD